jgi:hypothetical protein
VKDSENSNWFTKWRNNVALRRKLFKETKQQQDLLQARIDACNMELRKIEGHSHFGSFPYRLQYRQLVDFTQEKMLVDAFLRNKGILWVWFKLPGTFL